MGRMYTVDFSEIAVSAQQDLFQLEGVTIPSIIHAFYVSQSSDVGDANAAMVSLQIRRFTDDVTDESLAVPLDVADAAALNDVAINETTELETGQVILHAEVWNIALPWVWLPPPEMRIVVPVGDGVALNMNTTDTLTMDGTMYFEEVGS